MMSYVAPPVTEVYHCGRYIFNPGEALRELEVDASRDEEAWGAGRAAMTASHSSGFPPLR